MSRLHMGIDVGSTTVKVVVLDENNNTLFAEYRRHFSDIKSTVKGLFAEVKEVVKNEQFTVVITGSGGLLLSKMLDLPFVQEVIANKTAIKTFMPETDVVIELGGEDAKILYLSGGLEQRMNGTCAGGTGSFIDQMSILLKTDADGLNALAEKHTIIYPIAARCGVFAKSDVQPLLNEGAAREDIAASILQAVVTQTISGLAANPAIGAMSDLVVQAGGTSILSETSEFIGAEHILARRAINKEVHDRIYEITSRFEAHFHAVGEDVRQGNPSPGNKAGGITTLEEKSLGCIHKGGHSPINAVYDYAKQVESKQGLVIMDTPGNDPASVAAMVAGGAQVIVFSSGRGSPVGHPIAPVVKVTGNKITFANMEDNIDFCAAPLIYGEKTVEQLGTDLLNMVVETACGKQTKAEALGFVETAIARICNYV